MEIVMSEQLHSTTPAGRRQLSKNHLGADIRKYTLTCEPLYQTSEEIYEALRKHGCVHLPRNNDAARIKVRKYVTQNSRVFGKRAEDNTFVLLARLRALS
jgi:hypothetical protein